MNPPFSALANVDRQMAGAALRHISSALARLTEGGRLVAITGASCAPDNSSWTEHFVRLQETRTRCLLRRHRWRRLRQAWHDHRHALDRHRSPSGRRSDDFSGFARDCARCRHTARLGDGNGPAAVAESRLRSPFRRPFVRRSCGRRAPSLRVQFRSRPRRQSRRLWNWPMRRSNGSRSKAEASRRRFTRNMDCSRSGSRTPGFIRPNWCSRRRWLRSRRPNRPIGRICLPISSPAACCRTPS